MSDWEQPQQFVLRIINEKPKHILIPGLIAECYGVSGARVGQVSASLLAAYASIVALDDVLDGDQRYTTSGLSPAGLANLSAGLTALAYRLLSGLDDEASRDWGIAVLTDLIYKVAYGQALDAENIASDEAYWRVAQLKSGGFFSGAFALGALAADVNAADWDTLQSLGETYGILIQIHDDLRDAFAVPADPDWLNGRFTLPILFAHLVEHPDRARFNQIRGQVTDPAALEEAQEILIRSGALSYGFYKIEEYNQQARRLISQLTTVDKTSLVKLFNELVTPVEQLVSALIDTPVDAAVVSG
ncbi:polyprenyl synthetase family protein [bacterium]|nr:polyprenyl synthetase family protein [bacterium]